MQKAQNRQGGLFSRSAIFFGRLPYTSSYRALS